MGDWTQTTAEDGHSLSVYLADGVNSANPGVVVLQEIFGVTDELKEVAEKLARHGFRAAVPSIYDRIERGCVLPYDDPDRARAAKNQLRYDEIECDIAAALKLADTGNGVALLGYCWGGGLAYWMAQKYPVDAVVSYYGTNLAQYCRSDSRPSARCQFHFGVDDPMIDAAARETIKRCCSDRDQYFEYAGAGHAFANVARPSYRRAQAAAAEERSLCFLDSVFTGTKGGIVTPGVGG